MELAKGAYHPGAASEHRDVKRNQPMSEVVLVVLVLGTVTEPPWLRHRVRVFAVSWTT